MRLVEDARRLAKAWGDWFDEDGNCFRFLCDRSESDGAHAPDCPWLSMPQIVAVLEAAERLVEDDNLPLWIPRYQGGVEILACVGCGVKFKNEGILSPEDIGHEDGCKVEALVTAMRGEGVTT